MLLEFVRNIQEIQMQLSDIAYALQHGIDGLGDLWLPERISERTQAVLLIHGGDWATLDKSSLNGVASYLCQKLDMAVYNINYRLCGLAPWPACGEDSLEAADFLLNSNLLESRSISNDKIWLIGASAGGHLAVMTGLRLPSARVAGIISISGIASVQKDYAVNPERYKNLFGHPPDDNELKTLDPVNYLHPSSPAILCTHELNDNVVPVCVAEDFIEAASGLGIAVDNFFYEKGETCYSHRIWIPESSPHKLYPEIERKIAQFITSKGDF